jgi:MFS family permease
MSLFDYRDYRDLFVAQFVSLFGTGLTAVALGLLAYQFAGADAGAVLGTALTIKMVIYVSIAPIAAAYADRVPRRLMLVGLDLIRAVTCGSARWRVSGSSRRHPGVGVCWRWIWWLRPVGPSSWSTPSITCAMRSGDRRRTWRGCRPHRAPAPW